MVVMRRQKPIGEKLIEKGLIDEEILKKALEEQAGNGERLVDILVEDGYINDSDALEVLSAHVGIKGKTITLKEIRTEAFDLFTINYMKENLFIPYSIMGNKLNVVMEDPNNKKLIEEIQRKSGMNVKPFLCTKRLIEENIRVMMSQKSEKSSKRVESILSELNKSQGREIELSTNRGLEDIERSFGSENALVVRGVNAMIAKAIEMKASDIHIEPYEKDIRIRFRVDGLLLEVQRMPKYLINGLISRIKIMSNLDIAERRLPQDGRFRIKISGNYVDFRVSIIPTAYGEKSVMRILDKSSVNLDLDTLGFDKDALDKLYSKIRSPYGIILVTGPTGSGKSTTLYSVLNILNTSKVNISTVEDPIEYELEGINQVQCRSEIGLDFASSLRSFLRQDPDIIMVGEIRDKETSEIAIKAALTGHLVLSTLHTNDAPSSIHRLINMGIEPFMISASLLMVQAQRLVRRICPHCKEVDDDYDETLEGLGLKKEEYSNIKFYIGRGCSECNNTGYKGRAAIYEIMTVSEEIKELISRGATTLEIGRQAKKEGMVTLRESGMKKAEEGVTTLEEVLRVTLI